MTSTLSSFKDFTDYYLILSTDDCETKDRFLQRNEINLNLLGFMLTLVLWIFENK